MLRAVWSDIRAFDARRDVEEYVEWCRRNGITVTFPCVNHCTGVVTFPSDVAPRSARFDRWDPMPDLVGLCHAAGTEVHIWVCCGHWGPAVFDGTEKHPPSAKGPRPLQETHRDWFTVNHLGQSVLDECAGGDAIQRGGFLNLGLPPVQDFIDGLFAEIMDRYEVDGVHLDYIRSNLLHDDWSIEVPAADRVWAAAKVGDIFQMTPRSGEPKRVAPGGFRAVEVWGIEDLAGEAGAKARRRITLRHAGRYGFNDATMKAFEAETGVGYAAAGADTPERVAWLYQRHREDWHAWKSAQITRLVRRISRTTRARKRKLSAAVFSSIPWCGQEVAQRWAEWCNERLLDFVCPMDYCLKPGDLAKTIDEQNSFLKEPRIPSFAGILTGCDLFEIRGEELPTYEEVAKSHGQAGVCLFSYNTFRRVLP